MIKDIVFAACQLQANRQKFESVNPRKVCQHTNLTYRQVSSAMSKHAHLWFQPGKKWSKRYACYNRKMLPQYWNGDSASTVPVEEEETRSVKDIVMDVENRQLHERIGELEESYAELVDDFLIAEKQEKLTLRYINLVQDTWKLLQKLLRKGGHLA